MSLGSWLSLWIGIIRPSPNCISAASSLRVVCIMLVRDWWVRPLLHKNEDEMFVGATLPGDKSNIPVLDLHCYISLEDYRTAWEADQASCGHVFGQECTDLLLHIPPITVPGLRHVPPVSMSEPWSTLYWHSGTLTGIYKDVEPVTRQGRSCSG